MLKHIRLINSLTVNGCAPNLWVKGTFDPFSNPACRGSKVPVPNDPWLQRSVAGLNRC